MTPTIGLSSRISSGQRVLEGGVDVDRAAELAGGDAVHRLEVGAVDRGDRRAGAGRGRRPRTSATKSSAGAPRIAAGVSYCASRPPVGEDRDPVAHLHRLVDVVGDQQHGLAELALEPQELVLQPAADHRVDGAERLVHQQHRRVGGERPGHADALPLAAGELVRVAVGVRRRVEPDEVHQLVAPARARSPWTRRTAAAPSSRW